MAHGRQYTALQFPEAARIIPNVILIRSLFAFLLLAAVAARADDWPQFLGPTRDNVYAGRDLADTWPAGGPKTVWQKNVGAGWSGPVVSGGKLILLHRVADKETVECLDAASGKPLWTGDYATAYSDDFGF